MYVPELLVCIKFVGHKVDNVRMEIMSLEHHMWPNSITPSTAPLPGNLSTIPMIGTR